MNGIGTPLEAFISCRHTLKALDAAGIHSMEQLRGTTRERLLALRGIGPVIADDLMKAAAGWNADPAGAAVIERVERDTARAEELLCFVEGCSWLGVRDHIAQMIRDWAFTDWEGMFAAIADGRIVGMASVMKTDYYPLPDIYPWVSCIFVDEAYRGRRLSGELIACANRYLLAQGFRRSYIPSEFTGLYERYGYRFVKDIVNYGGGVDHLFIKEFDEPREGS